MEEKIQNLNNDEFWTKFYKNFKKPYEMYESYKHYKTIFKDNISTNDNILLNANGYSNLIFDFYDNGYKYIKAIDKNEKVIKFLKDKNKTKDENLKIKLKDIFNINNKKSSYNCIIDKGFIDLLLSTENGIAKTEEILNKFDKILKIKGKIIIITIYYDIIIKIIKFSNKFKFSKLKLYNTPINFEEKTKENYVIIIFK